MGFYALLGDRRLTRANMDEARGPVATVTASSFFPSAPEPPTDPVFDPFGSCGFFGM